MDLIIADDRALNRACLRRVLESRADLHVVAEASTGEELIELLPNVPARILLLDCILPGPPVSQLVRIIRSRRGSPRVLLLGVRPGHSGVEGALRAGAAGALCREATEETLIEAIRRIAAGGQYVSASLTDRRGPPVPGLSGREFDVLRLLGSGKSGREIAEQLGLSPKTISTYRTRLQKKLGLRNAAELVRYAVDHGHAF